MRSADRDSQDKNFVGSLDRFAKTAGSRDAIDSILTHVIPLYIGRASTIAAGSQHSHVYVIAHWLLNNTYVELWHCMLFKDID